ncbi:OmpA family protein [Thiolinea disciformis]|uniref:OmpA family protein n=1 Tax=Thiolinea disciformis TaxID=125614 RepID=UPI00036AF2A8|nr:OmpA family protein [Thiolinea disciformis]
MKLKSLAVLALAGVWGASGWWWYACQIKGFCGEPANAHTSETTELSKAHAATEAIGDAKSPATTDAETVTSNDSNKPLDEQASLTAPVSTDTSASVLPKLKPKLSTGSSSNKQTDAQAPVLAEPNALDSQGEEVVSETSSTEENDLAAANQAAEQLAEKKLAENGQALVAATSHSTADKTEPVSTTAEVKPEPTLAVGDPIPPEPDAIVLAQNQDKTKAAPSASEPIATPSSKKADAKQQEAASEEPTEDKLKREKAKDKQDKNEKSEKSASDAKNDKTDKDNGDKLTVETIGKDDEKDKDKNSKDKKKVKSIKAARLYFPFRSSRPELADESKDYVESVVTYLKENPKASITLTGHTDNVGDADYNEKVGLKRAEAVKKLLVRQGAPADQIKVDSKGESQAIASNKEEEGRKKNRRVELTPNRK